MALEKKIKNLYLDKVFPNCKYAESLLQGSLDKILRVTVLDENVEQTVGDTAEITVIVLYNPRTEFGKVITDGSYVLDKDSDDFDVTISDGKINIPLHDEMVTYAGKNQLIILINETFVSYTYQMEFEVARNNAYPIQDLPNDIINFKKLQQLIEELTLRVAANEINITGLQTEMTTKANSDLSNVGDFANIEDGKVLIKKDGELKDSGIMVDGDDILAPTKNLRVKNLDTDPSTINLGVNVSISENGGFVQNHTKTLDKNYLMVDYENDDLIGSSKPVYYAREAKETVIIQNDDSITMNNVTTFNTGSPAYDRQLQAIYLNLLSPVTNFSYKLIVNSNDVYYYPSRFSFENKVNGINLGAGVQKIDFTPFFSNLTEYTVEFVIQANEEINLLGNGSIPWYQLDINRIDRKIMALMEDIKENDYEEIARGLEGLPGNDKLDYVTGLKNQPTIPNDSIDLSDMPQILEAGKMLRVKPDGTGYELVDDYNVDPATIARGIEGLIESEKLDYELGLKNQPDVPVNSTDLNDMPNTLVGEAGKILLVKENEEGYELIEHDFSDGKITNIVGNQLNEYDPTQNYVTSNIVVYQNIMRYCKNETTGDFNQNDWINTNISLIQGQLILNEQKIDDLEVQLNKLPVSYTSYNFNSKNIATKYNLNNGDSFILENINELLECFGVHMTSERQLPKYFESDDTCGIYNDLEGNDIGVDLTLVDLMIPAKNLNDTNILRLFCKDYEGTGNKNVYVYNGDASSGGVEIQPAYGEKNGDTPHETGYKIPTNCNDIHIYLSMQYLLDLKLDSVSGKFIITNVLNEQEGERIPTNAVNFLDSENVIFVSNKGNDSNDGKTQFKQKLTLASAVTAAKALPGDKLKTIVCLDSSTFVENLSIDEPINVYMPYAKLQGNLTTIANDFCEVNIFEVEGTVGVHSHDHFVINELKGDITILDSSNGTSFINIHEWFSGNIATGSAQGIVIFDIKVNTANVTIEPTANFTPRGFIEGKPINNVSDYNLLLNVNANGTVAYQGGTYEGTVTVSRVDGEATGAWRIVPNNDQGHVFSFDNTHAQVTVYNQSEAHTEDFGFIFGYPEVKTYDSNGTLVDVPFMLDLKW